MLDEPRFSEEGWLVEGTWQLKPDAPDWAVEEYNAFRQQMERNGKPDKDGFITWY